MADRSEPGAFSDETYRLILVDDEAIVREGISQCVPWNNNGFELAGMFEHGIEALEYIEHHPVDVVISDINMPRMDGLTLSRILTERFPSIMVLLLTGYDDFEYAQEAVKNQVRQFLLKPITAAELSEVLVQIRTELNIFRHRELQQKLMQEKLHQSFPLLKERFFYRLVTGRLSPEQIAERREYFQWQDLQLFYQIIIVRIPESWSDLERISLLEFIKSTAGKNDEVFQNSEENIVVLMQESSIDRLELNSRESARKAYHQAAQLGKEQISIGCGEVVDSPIRIQRSYDSASTAIDYSRVLGVSQILSINDVRRREQISPEGFNALAKNLIDQLKEGRRTATKEALERIFLYLEEHYLTPLEASHYFNRLHLHLFYFLQEIELFSQDTAFFSLQPEAFSSITRAKEFFRNMIDSIEDQIDRRRQDLIVSRIEKAKRIIAERFSESSFSLRDICEEIYLSTSQFSHLFKEGTGQTFVEYLTNYRIEEAKKLLKTTSLKGYEIAERVGYTDPRYFSIIFKKNTGMTAMEYRRSLEE